MEAGQLVCEKWVEAFVPYLTEVIRVIDLFIRSANIIAYLIPVVKFRYNLLKLYCRTILEAKRIKSLSLKRRW